MPARMWKSLSRRIGDELGAPRDVSGAGRRILVYRLGSLGDTVVALPCFHKIAEAFPDAERYVLTNAPVSSKASPLVAVLENSGLIHGVVDYPLRLRSVGQIVALAWTLRRLGASTLVYLTMPRDGRLRVYRDLLFFRLCGFERIIGAPLGRGSLWLRPDPATGLAEQECKRLARTLAELGPIDLDNRSNWDLRLTDAERAVGTEALQPIGSRPFLAINMGGKAVEKNWGVVNWRRLLEDLARTHGEYGILAVGVGEEAADVETVTRDWPGPVVNACGRLAPRETAAALGEARLFVGHDSGPLHLAAACGVPCIGLYGAVNEPAIWHPYGRGHTVIHRMEGIAAIGVAEVAASVRDHLPAVASERACS